MCTVDCQKADQAYPISKVLIIKDLNKVNQAMEKFFICFLFVLKKSQHFNVSVYLLHGKPIFFFKISIRLESADETYFLYKYVLPINNRRRIFQRQIVIKNVTVYLPKTRSFVFK